MLKRKASQGRKKWIPDRNSGQKSLNKSFDLDIGVVTRPINKRDLLFLGFVRDELKRGRIDAIAQSSGGRAILENVAQMATTTGTIHLHPVHSKRVVFTAAYMFRIGGFRKARPATTGVELAFGKKKF